MPAPVEAANRRGSISAAASKKLTESQLLHGYIVAPGDHRGVKGLQAALADEAPALHRPVNHSLLVAAVAGIALAGGIFSDGCAHGK